MKADIPWRNMRKRRMDALRERALRAGEGRGGEKKMHYKATCTLCRERCDESEMGEGTLCRACEEWMRFEMMDEQIRDENGKTCWATELAWRYRKEMMNDGRW